MKNQPLYVISIVAEILGLHPQTLRQYEKIGLVIPSRSVGNSRRYSEDDVEKLRYITSLTKDMGVNLAGVQIIMEMKNQISSMNRQISSVEEHIRTKYGEDIKLKNNDSSESSVKIKIERE